jgi:hypothetical protein
MIPVFAMASINASETDRMGCGDVTGKKLAGNEVLFAYSIEGKLDALVLYNGSEFLPADGQEFKYVREMFDFRDQKRYSVSFETYRTRLGEDRCVWFARLPENKPASISIFSSRKFEWNKKIDPKVVELFYSINTDCVSRGDTPPGERIPCKKPGLLATSDLNSNGRLELWYSYPYTYDTGFALAELSESGSSLDIIAAKCLDCD